MASDKPYNYSFRPGYGSIKMMLQFHKGTDRKEFLDDLFSELLPLDVKVASREDRMIADVVFHLVSNAGEFELCFDEWGMVFLEGGYNQKGIQAVRDILSKSNLFESLPVNMEEYKRTSMEGDKSAKSDEPPHKS